jgi:uncharacterized protein YkwD
MHRRATGFGTRQALLYLAPFVALTVLGLVFARSLIGPSDTVANSGFSDEPVTAVTTPAASPVATPALVVDASLQSLGVKKGKITLPGPAGSVEGGFVMFVIDGPKRVVRSDNSAPFSIKLDTSTLPNGTYTVTVLWTHKNKSSVASTSTLRIANPAKKKPSSEPSETDTSTKPSTSGGSYAQQVLGLTNKERAKVGCKALSASSKLTKAAQGHSADMAAHDYFSHDSRNGDDPFRRIRDAGYSFAAAAENIAMGQQTPSDVMKAWMNSAGHKANILNCTYTQLGVGYALGGGSPYWTQNFGKPL